MLQIIIFFTCLYLISSQEISDINSIYKQTFHFNRDSINKFYTRYSHLKYYDDLKRIIIDKNEKTLNNESVIIWNTINSAIFEEDSAKFNHAFQNLRIHYKQSDKSFLLTYYQHLKELVFYTIKNKKAFNQYLYTLKNNSFLSSILHEYLYKCAVNQNFKGRYIDYVKLKVYADSNLSIKLKNTNYSYLYYYLRSSGSYEVAEIFLNFAIRNMYLKTKSDSIQRNGFITDLMELNFDQNKIKKNIELKNLVNQKTLEAYEKEYIKIFTGNHFDVDMSSLDDEGIKSYINYKKQSIELKTAIKNRKKILIEEFDFDTVYKQNFDELLISYSALFNPLKAEALYQKYKPSFVKEMIEKGQLLWGMNKVFSSNSIVDYLNHLNDNEKAIEEFIFYQTLQSINEIKLSNMEKVSLKQMDLQNEDLSSFIDLFNSKQEVKIRSIEKAQTLNQFVNHLKRGESLVIYLKGLLDGKIYLLRKDQEISSYQSFDQDLLDELKSSAKIIVFDPESKLLRFFSEKYFQRNHVIPNIYYIPNIMLLMNRSNKEHLEKALFIGNDEAFSYKEKYYPKLYYIKEEMAIIENNFISRSYYNYKNTIKDFNTELLIISGHFIKSEIHPIFNKIANGVSKEKLFSLSPYEINSEVKTANLVILNACESGQNTVYNSFSGQQQFAQYLINSGVKSVIIAKKVIDDKTASIFIENFIRHIKAGEFASVALQKAKLYIKDNYNSNPAFWDSYELYGSDSQFIESEIMILDISLYIFLSLLIVFAIRIVFYSKS